MKKLSLFATLIVIAIIAIGGAYMFPQVKEVADKVGAFAGPDIDSKFLSVNGVEVWYASQKFNNASTTRCAIQSPRHATSTLSTDSVVMAATSTDYTLAIAKSATAYATTTQIRTETVTDAGKVVFPMATTTQTALADTNRTFAPGQWLVVSAAGPTATAFDSGSCSAVFNVAK